MFVNASLIVDIVLIVVSLFLLYSGYRQGFIRAAGSLLGLVVSIAISIWGVTWLEALTGFELTKNPIVFVLVFLTLAVVVSQIIRLIVTALDLVRKLLSIIPFVGLINSVLGLALGAVQVLVLLAGISYATVNVLPVGAFRHALLGSTLVGNTVKVGEELKLL